MLERICRVPFGLVVKRGVTIFNATVRTARTRICDICVFDQQLVIFEATRYIRLQWGRRLSRLRCLSSSSMALHFMGAEVSQHLAHWWCPFWPAGLALPMVCTLPTTCPSRTWRMWISMTKSCLHICPTNSGQSLLSFNLQRLVTQSRISKWPCLSRRVFNPWPCPSHLVLAKHPGGLGSLRLIQSEGANVFKQILGGGFKFCVLFLEKWFDLTSIFQLGWKHQLELHPILSLNVDVYVQSFTGSIVSTSNGRIEIWQRRTLQFPAH